MTMDRPSGGAESPQTIITAEDLLKKLRAGVKETHEIRLRELVVPVRVLSIDETNAIRREAIANAAKLMGDETDKSLYAQKLTLKLASTLNKNGAPILSDKLLSMMTVDEVNHLYNEYITVMDSVNPSLETITSEQFRFLVDGLKKNTLTSRDLSLHQLRAICTSFADLIQRQETHDSPTDN